MLKARIERGREPKMLRREPKMPLLTELENVFVLFLQRYQAYGAYPVCWLTMDRVSAGVFFKDPEIISKNVMSGWPIPL